MDRTQFLATAGTLVVALGGFALGQGTVRVSLDSRGVQGDADCSYPLLSPDGRFVVFTSRATNLVPGDSNDAFDVFVRDRLSGETTRVNVSSSGIEANDQSEAGGISADGRYVAFSSLASNLVDGDTNGERDLFVRDRQTGLTRRVSLTSGGTQANGGSAGTISADGRYVAFTSEADNLLPGDTNGEDDVFVRDLVTGQLIRASLDSSGAQGNGESYAASISADGRYVAFVSDADNLVPGDTNSQDDVFVHNLVTGNTVLVSVGNGGQSGNAYSSTPVISAEGRHVAFVSDASNLVAVDLNGMSDIFVRDLLLGQTRLATVDSAGNQSDVNTYYAPAISANGRYVAFNSTAHDLTPPDMNPGEDVFLHDFRTGETILASVDAAGVQGNQHSYEPAMSAEGRFVAFKSRATNLAPGDTNGFGDIYVRDLGSVQAVSFCAGDGSAGLCPCLAGTPGQGCDNSVGTGGASLLDFDTASLFNDTLVLLSSGEIRGVTSVFLQGDAQIPPAAFGDGLRCAGGHLKRLFVKSASAGGFVAAPGGSDPSISARSTALGDPITAGETRYYQTYYRDPDPNFCSTPSGSAWNVSSGLSILWRP